MAVEHGFLNFTPVGDEDPVLTRETTPAGCGGQERIRLSGTLIGIRSSRPGRSARSTGDLINEQNARYHCDSGHFAVGPLRCGPFCWIWSLRETVRPFVQHAVESRTAWSTLWCAVSAAGSVGDDDRPHGKRSYAGSRTTAVGRDIRAL